MPIIDIDSPSSALRSVGAPEFEDKAPTFKESFVAATAADTAVGAIMVRERGLPDSVINGDYSAWDDLTDDEKLDESFVKKALYADDSTELEAIRRQKLKEERNRDLVNRGGFLPSLAAGIVNPANYIPIGGAAYATYRNGASILKSAAVTSASAAASVGVEEAVIHRNQVSRAVEESLANISGAAFLGGVLGATPAALRGILSKANLDEQQTFDQIEEVMGGSVGAAAVDTNITVKGKAAQWVMKKTPFDPLTRSMTSDVEEVRHLVARLAENPNDLENFNFQAVHSKIKAHDGKYYKAVTTAEPIYKEYRSAGGKLSRRQFNEEVGKAVRNGSSNPHIQRAADAWDTHLMAPLKDAAIEAKLLDDSVDVKTAKNYLMRIWNKDKLRQNMPRFVDITSRWLRNQRDDLDIEDADDLAREIMGRILGTPDGRLPYSYKIGETSTGAQTRAFQKLKGPFKSRVFNIPDKLVDEFLENDIELVSARYLRAVAPDIELAKEFGDVTLENEISKIQAVFTEKIEAAQRAGDKKLADKLLKQQRRAIGTGERAGDIQSMRDRIRGTFGDVDHNNPWVRAGRVARDLNYMRLLGGVVASSIPDIGRVVAAEGMMRVFGKGLTGLVTQTRGFRLAAHEAKLGGAGTDALMGGRAEIIADTVDYAQGGTAFERAVRSSSVKFSYVNLMNQWTGGMKQLHAVTMQTRVIDELRQGVYDPRLAQLGISEANAQNIAKELGQHAQKIDGVWVANTERWESQELAMMWRTALRKESDRVIIVPGEEKPLFMSTEWGKTIFQFKSFLFSATQRILISNLQRQDRNQMIGLTSMISLGMLSYAFKEWDAGREPSEDPGVWVAEGIDRSGALGIFMEANNTLEKITGNEYGLRPLFGVDAPATRYASRSTVDSLLGPTLGLAQTFSQIATASTDDNDFSEADARALLKLIPGQNLSFIRQSFDELAENIDEAL